jgi:nickel/cobalt exporter
MGTAVTIGFLHTLLGPDHYLPFVMMARARNWSVRRTLLITGVCGLGHVLGSVLLGLVGVALGIALGKLEGIEGVRGGLAAWGLIAFGLAYCAWGLRSAWRCRPHSHAHAHGDVDEHQHHHVHGHNHAHLHGKKGGATLTPWVLFVIFILGPCEVLIPLLMYPAAKGGYLDVLIVVSAFGLTTIVTMLAVVLLLTWGLKLLSLGKLECYTHALAGGAIALSGIAIQALGL